VDERPGRPEEGIVGHQTAGIGQVIVARLEHGADLLEELTRVAHECSITLGHVTAIGAVTSARFAFYDQTAHTYGAFDLTEPLEIASLIGNVSYRDRETFVHAHVTLSDKTGKCCAGHLVEGCVVFACEAVITQLVGRSLHRSLDEVTGLTLWEELK
jgi:predicted DNA-binding protein with PD1-like motif